jgi:hypothetical protein
MADISDVENALVALIADAIYPNGSTQASVINADLIVGRGWPVPEKLYDDLKAGKVTVSVYPQNGVERNTTRFTTDIHTLNIPAPTVTATISGQTITFTGSLPTPQNIGVIIGDFSPTAKTAIYPATSADTMITIAAGLAALLVTAGIAATASGPVLTLPATAIASASVGVFGTAWQELKRQERSIQVTLWCPTPAMRDLAAPLIDVALVQNEHLLLDDGSGARLVYQRTMISDERQTVEIYRRDLVYMVEYATTLIRATRRSSPPMPQLSAPSEDTMKALIVTEPFADYAKGDQITDSNAIDKILVEHSGQVVAINLPDPDPAPDAPAKDTAKPAPQVSNSTNP